MRSSSLGRALMIGTGFAALLAAGSAQAQMPPGPPEASEIAACLCLRAEVDHLHGDMSMRQASYGNTQSELARLDAQLQSQRANLDVNNPAAVAQFRQLLEQRDAVFRRSTGPLARDAAGVTARYNDRIAEYNARCANRPRNPDLLARVQATLTCPPLH
ncbi:MAG TPA: hypothetical protein VHY35_03280 [Stellaceae bacterium]|jgi:hypothetical protein|nr:hypothetical protein [Stellaceae bacterium]